MRRLRLVFPLMALCGLCFSACNSWTKVEFREREVSELFKLDLPDYFDATDVLNQEAELQLQNSGKDLCLIVRKNDWNELRKRRADFVLEDYYDVSIEQLKADLEKIDAPGPDSISINGLPAFLGTLTGNFKGDRLIFDIGIIAGESYLYQLVLWTSAEERPVYQADIMRIIHSFEEMENPIQNEGIQSDQPEPLSQPDSNQTLSQPQNMPSDQ
ncbi:MAG: hypothetical protein R8P61_04790 [Bacteroidia bacterium]|nr:hypothetical protein [Bacteroidia bacterium]